MKPAAIEPSAQRPNGIAKVDLAPFEDRAAGYSVNCRTLLFGAVGALAAARPASYLRTSCVAKAIVMRVTDERQQRLSGDVWPQALPSSAQTAAAWSERSCCRRAPVGAAMLSDVVTERRPSAVAAAHCTYPGKLPVWP